MRVLARHNMVFGGRDVAANEPVVDLDGNGPQGHVFTRLLRAGKIWIEGDDQEVVAGNPTHKQSERVARSNKRQATKAGNDGDDD